MSADVLFPLIFGALAVVVAIVLFRGDEWDNSPGFGTLAICFACFMFWCAYDNTKPEVQAAKAAEAARVKATDEYEKTPHIVREADGCKVYAFKSGDRWHYFTRCPDSRTVTDTAYEQCTGSGKTRSCKELHDSIEVTNK